MTKPKASRTVHRGKGSTPAQPPAPEAAKGKGWTLATPPDPAGRPPDEFMARTAAGGIVGNARTVVAFAHGTFGELSLTECTKVLKETAGGLNGGDLSSAVTMLSSQAVALDAMFAELARRSALNMGTYMDASERYLRLALKAQGQCRATLETLAAIKNPPVVFARQANINNGGQQQVNNGASANSTPASAHPGDTAFQPNELLEDLTDGRTQLDTRAAPATSRAHQDVATVGAVNRAANT